MTWGVFKPCDETAGRRSNGVDLIFMTDVNLPSLDVPGGRCLRRQCTNCDRWCELLRHLSVGPAVLFLHDDATPRFGSKIRRGVTDGGRFSSCKARLAFSGGRNRAPPGARERCGYRRRRMHITMIISTETGLTTYVTKRFDGFSPNTESGSSPRFEATPPLTRT